MRRLAADVDRCVALADAALARREADDDVGTAAALITSVLAHTVAAGHRRSTTEMISVAPMPDQHTADPAPAPAVAARGDVRQVARAATAPVRNFFNQHFEMVKHEVRTHTGDQVHLANLIHELESTVAETSLHQARTIARLRDDSAALQARVVELERVIERLTEVVAAATLQRVDDPA